MNERREPLRRTFDTAANLYESTRPAYPEELFDDLVELTQLEPGARLLEIGCATGKATLPMLKRGFSVVCVEIGPQLAERARSNLSGFPSVRRAVNFCVANLGWIIEDEGEEGDIHKWMVLRTGPSEMLQRPIDQFADF